MALNFPDPATQTPVNTFSPSSTPSASTNGITYLWDGQKWNAQTNGDAAFWQRVGTTLSPATVGDNISTTGDLTTADATVDTLTSNGDVQVGSLNSGPLAGFRNQIINNTGVIAQRGASITAASDGDYTLDRWNTGGGVVVTKQTGLGGLCPGFDNAISITTTAGRNWIRQGVELGTTGFAGKFTGQWTLSVWATQAPSCALSFSDDASFTNTVQVVANTAMTATGEPDRVNGIRTYRHYSHTFTISQTPNASNECLAVQLSFPISSQTLFTGVQLEPGPVSTPLEMRPIGTELALCQRYFEVASVEVAAPGVAGAFVDSYWFFKVNKRSSPTITLGVGNAGNLVRTDVDGTAIRSAAGGSQVSFGDRPAADAEL